MLNDNEINVLQLALDNFVVGMLPSGKEKISALRSKLEAMKSAQQSVQPTALCAGHPGGSDVKNWICQTCGLPMPHSG